MAQSRRRPVRAGAQQKEPAQEPVGIRVYWRQSSTENVPLVFANVVFVGLADGNVIMTLGHVLPPPEHPLSEQTRKQLEEEGVEAKPVARVLIPGAHFERIMGQLDTILESWRKQAKGLPSPREGGR